MSKKYRIVGGRPVAGKQPGDLLDEEELAGLNVDALIRGGHVIEKITVKKKTVVEQQEEETD